MLYGLGLESAPGLGESDSSPYFWDSDLDSDSNFSDSDLDLDSDPKHETKLKAIHELVVNDWSQEKFVFPSRA